MGHSMKKSLKGFISLIPKEGTPRLLIIGGHFFFFTVIYKIFVKTLQLRLQPMLRDVISPN